MENAGILPNSLLSQVLLKREIDRKNVETIINVRKIINNPSLPDIPLNDGDLLYVFWNLCGNDSSDTEYFSFIPDEDESIQDTSELIFLRSYPKNAPSRSNSCFDYYMEITNKILKPHLPFPTPIPMTVSLIDMHQGYYKFKGKSYPREVKTTNAGVEMVLIEPGDLIVDDHRGWEITQLGWEQTIRQEFKITQPFYIGKYEVSVAQFNTFISETGYKTDAEQKGYALNSVNKKIKGMTWKDPGYPQDNNEPVTCVSWKDAEAFCAWIGGRLPTEMEWEYACRAGTTTKYSFGDRITTNLANYNGSITDYWHNMKNRIFRRKTMPINSFKPNYFGLYNIHGNISEWCVDWITDEIPLLQLCGGSWRDAWDALESSYARRGTIADNGNDIGFRVACSIQEMKKNTEPHIEFKATPESIIIVDNNFILKNNGLIYGINSEDPFTGEKIEYYSNGQKKSEIEYHNGKIDGRSIKWYENGQKSEEVAWHNNKEHGKYIKWYQNGQKEIEINKRNGRLNGKALRWNENGQKLEEANYHDGKRQGKFNIWYENGQKSEEGEWRDNIEHGEWTYWYENGQKKMEREWNKGKLISMNCWDEDGNSVNCYELLRTGLRSIKIKR